MDIGLEIRVAFEEEEEAGLSLHFILAVWLHFIHGDAGSLQGPDSVLDWDKDSLMEERVERISNSPSSLLGSISK